MYNSAGKNCRLLRCSKLSSYQDYVRHAREQISPKLITTPWNNSWLHWTSYYLHTVVEEGAGVLQRPFPPETVVVIAVAGVAGSISDGPADYTATLLIVQEYKIIHRIVCFRSSILIWNNKEIVLQVSKTKRGTWLSQIIWDQEYIYWLKRTYSVLP